MRKKRLALISALVAATLVASSYSSLAKTNPFLIPEPVKVESPKELKRFKK